MSVCFITNHFLFFPFSLSHVWFSPHCGNLACLFTHTRTHAHTISVSKGPSWDCWPIPGKAYEAEKTGTLPHFRFLIGAKDSPKPVLVLLEMNVSVPNSKKGKERHSHKCVHVCRSPVCVIYCHIVCRILFADIFFSFWQRFMSNYYYYYFFNLLNVLRICSARGDTFVIKVL